jgi:hypothetical protein
MAPFAICCNPSCDFFMDLYCDRRLGQVKPDAAAPCPICGWAKTDWCAKCRTTIEDLGPNGTFCEHCGADLKKAPLVIDRAAEDRQKRLAMAVKCLDELIIIVMERIAAESRIDEEELASACQTATDDDNDESLDSPLA